jgi:glycosyltransferase involved in cell wall biosynthesis
MNRDKSNEMPRVSVIINCFNGEQFLKEAIDSVYAQTFTDWEIIFWDNASTDGSEAIAKSYDTKLRYFKAKENVVLGAARNYAISQARGDYVAFLDTDDVWIPEKLAIQVKAMDEGGYDLGYAGIKYIDSKGMSLREYIPSYSSGMIFNDLLIQFDINVPTAILNRSTLITMGLNFDVQVWASEEYCLFMQLAVKSKILVTEMVLAKYRIHPSALTPKSISRWALEREYTLDRIRSTNPGIEATYKQGFREAYARAHYYRARYYLSQGRKSEAHEELKKNLCINIRYFLIWILSYFPISFWNLFHYYKGKRLW